jgi:hypothetical protein
MPSHSSNNGTQARLGSNAGRRSRFQIGFGVAAQTDPGGEYQGQAGADGESPSKTRNRLAPMCFHKAPSARSVKVRAMSLGAGIW